VGADVVDLLDVLLVEGAQLGAAAGAGLGRDMHDVELDVGGARAPDAAAVGLRRRGGYRIKISRAGRFLRFGGFGSGQGGRGGGGQGGSARGGLGGGAGLLGLRGERGALLGGPGVERGAELLGEALDHLEQLVDLALLRDQLLRQVGHQCGEVGRGPPGRRGRRRGRAARHAATRSRQHG
jgi:hypothetical protein